MNPNFVNRCKNYVKNHTAARNVLITYLRDDNHQPYGVVVATKLDNNDVKYGIALCNTKKDHFNKYVGTYIAVQRAITDKPITFYTNGHDKVFRTVCEMQNRANRYWKRELANA